MSLLTCQNCGHQWETASTPAMWHFKPTLSADGYTSPAMIEAADEEMTHCPKCPMLELEAAMTKGDRRGPD